MDRRFILSSRAGNRRKGTEVYTDLHIKAAACGKRARSEGKRRPSSRPPSCCAGPLKVEPELRGEYSRGDVMRPAEGGKEVVKSIFVGYVDGGQLQADFVLIPME
jgi:hypothetical protein